MTDNRKYKRVTIFAGHYGSGKTNIAVNYALWLSKFENKVAIADLDIVNPYFRTKDSEKILKDNKIRLISSDYANSNVDTPALPADMYAAAEDNSLYSVIDVGGDDRGALALGRYTPEILKENNYEMLFVINKFRPLTKTAADTVAIMQEIETAGGIRFTGIVNNSNLGEETKEEDVLESIDYANEVSKITGLAVEFTTVNNNLYDKLKRKINNLVPLSLYVKQSWTKQEGI